MALRMDETSVSQPDENESQQQLEKEEQNIIGNDAGTTTKVEAVDNYKGIHWRSCSWQKTATLLFSEYICMAILTFPWAYSVLGIVPGIILSVAISASVCYTSIILHRWCMRYPETQDMCDIGRMLAGGKKWGWWLTAICFCLNNTFIQALHVLMGAKFFNTITNHALCTNWFMLLSAVICFVCSLPRPFSTLSKFAFLSAISTFLMIDLAIIFAGVEYNRGYPYTKETRPRGNLWPKPDLSFSEGMTAFLNIAYTFIGQLTLPTFIAEMEQPKDFPKVVYAVSLAEMTWAVMAGTFILVWTGADKVKSPAFPHDRTFMLVCMGFAVPTIIFLGVLFSALTSKFVFFQIFKGSKHRNIATKTSTFSWGAIVAGTWLLAFLIAETIPIFSDMLGLMSSMFDSFLGFMFWGIAWINMRKQDYGKNWWRYRSLGLRGSFMLCLNWVLIAVGVYFLIPGTVATVQSIVESQKNAKMGGIFSCKNNAF